MNYEIKIPVRALAEYVFKSGSIESGFRTATSFTEGSRIHREIQKSYNEADLSEVFLKAEVVYDDIRFIIEGRCDGLLQSGDRMKIDEIKSTSIDLDYIEEHSNPAHWAQAECYGYMYLQENELEQIDIQLTYIHKSTGEKKQFVRTKARRELEDSMMYMIAEFAPYARLRFEQELRRNASIKDMPFPFKQYRKGQRQLAGSVYKTIQESKTLYASAPTGIGKTISTIFPSVKAIGEGHLQKLFYLTAKTTTRQTGEEAFRLMADCGLRMKVVTITAKDKVCFTGEGKCSKDYCEFADGYYDRINEAVLDILSNEDALDRKCVEAYALKHKVCPFEFSLDLVYAADAVICDYNYIFDPKVSLKRLFDEQKRQTALLVDEAHNLVDRGREMYSSSLEKAPFLQLKRDFKVRNPAIYKSVKVLNDHFINIRKQSDSSKSIFFDEPVTEFNAAVSDFIQHAEIELLKGNHEELLLETYFACQNWLRIAKLFDERYILYAEVQKNEVKLKQFCLDPSHLIRQAGKHFKARIFFSATLSPINYFKDMLGGEDGDYIAYIPSPFSEHQTDVIVQPLSTKFKDREISIKPIVRSLTDMVRTNPGNFLVFFPSYQYLHSVLEEWHIANEEIPTIVQRTGMTEAERDEFLQSFQPDIEGSLVGFAVLGGVFSEGVDLKGDRLNGVIVIGVGLPQIGLERDLIKKHFSSAGKNGFDYAYVFPGMNKVLQAGGRLIRSENDRGTILLIDDRYLQRKYQALLPDKWRNFTIQN
ncbi:ATP-dependent DNA helicase [Mesobacillus subterraneus]|uniref:ATP-dependent DNA helicase n=2 Tax=Mesobacillus subterraneus TaxID=285983 RepID=A0A427TML4_9BACI|nr:ATP-dependent DNA helicase [Mesobacillus subterraneus]RSD25594.1 ATP-dependent DNA helicase [Mesobacillus subterraneus]